jgi:hypothetical protein
MARTPPPLCRQAPGRPTAADSDFAIRKEGLAVFPWPPSSTGKLPCARRWARARRPGRLLGADPRGTATLVGPAGYRSLRSRSARCRRGGARAPPSFFRRVPPRCSCGPGLGVPLEKMSPPGLYAFTVDSAELAPGESRRRTRRGAIGWRLRRRHRQPERLCTRCRRRCFHRATARALDASQLGSQRSVSVQHGLIGPADSPIDAMACRHGPAAR